MAVKKSGKDIPLIELYRANIADPNTTPELRFWAAQELKRIESSFHSVEDALRTLKGLVESGGGDGGGGGGGGGGATHDPVTVTTSATIDLTLAVQNLKADVKADSIGFGELAPDVEDAIAAGAGGLFGNVDGGSPSDVYLAIQNIDGGTPSSIGALILDGGGP